MRHAPRGGKGSADSHLGDLGVRLTAATLRIEAPPDEVYMPALPPALPSRPCIPPPPAPARPPAMAQPTPVDVNSIRIIPEIDAKRRRTLVLCFDGTGDQFDADVSICRLYAHICSPDTVFSR